MHLVFNCAELPFHISRNALSNEADWVKIFAVSFQVVLHISNGKGKTFQFFFER